MCRKIINEKIECEFLQPQRILRRRVHTLECIDCASIFHAQDDPFTIVNNFIMTSDEGLTNFHRTQSAYYCVGCYKRIPFQSMWNLIPYTTLWTTTRSERESMEELCRFLSQFVVLDLNDVEQGLANVPDDFIESLNEMGILHMNIPTNHESDSDSDHFIE